MGYIWTVLLHPIGTECQQELSLKRNRLQVAMENIPLGQGPTHIWQVDDIGPMLVSPGGYKWVLIGIDNYSGLGITYPVVDANAQNTIK